MCDTKALVPLSKTFLSFLCMLWILLFSTRSSSLQFSSTSTFFRLTFWFFRRKSTYATSVGNSIISAFPSFPCRAVRPTRWTKTSASDGGSHWKTQSISSMSTPRAMTSVHRRIALSSSLNFFRIFVRFCFIFPWIDRIFVVFRRSGRISLQYSTQAHVGRKNIAFLISRLSMNFSIKFSFWSGSVTM